IFLRTTDADFETDVRDSNISDFGFRVTKRITNRITTTGGVTYTERSARGEVFDLEQIRYFINLDYSLTSRVALYTTYNHIDGDVFSTATPTIQIINWADAIEPDN